MEMPLPALVEKILHAFPKTQGIWLFGSAASGDATRDSDLDIAVLLPFGTPSSSSPERSLKDDLADLARRDVDLVLLRDVSTVFANEIVSHGKRIWEGDSRAMDEFEMDTLSLWQKLNQERKGILDDILAGGRILAHG
jgi:predicted nucleotidyltransferase